MKSIVSVSEMRKIEQKAIDAGITEEVLMGRAGDAIATQLALLTEAYHLEKKVFLLAGKGNNGGDGYTAAVQLIKKGFSVTALQVIECEEGSLCSKKRLAYKNAGGKFTTEFAPEGTILDAIFGSGFLGQVPDEVATLIQKVNQSKRLVVAIDIPSGLHGDTGEVSHAIAAHITLAIEFPKQGFFIGQGWNFVGVIQCLPIGLDPVTTELQYLEERDVASLFPKIARNRHKYEAGHVVGFAGSHGMAGAAMLASTAALKSGAGIVHLCHPKECTSEFAGPPWEIVRVGFESLEPVRNLMLKAKACFVGPGVGQTPALEALWDCYKDKSVIDADALNWIATSKKSIGPLPHSILTPHLGEMHRLLNIQTSEPVTLDFLRKCRAFVEKENTHLVLKGGPSFLFSAGEPILVMPRGDPGMATAGSGDVLTGILTSLLAQGMKAKEAMRLGTYLHAIAGEYAAKDETSYCMTASSIIFHLPYAFKALNK